MAKMTLKKARFDAKMVRSEAVQEGSTVRRKTMKTLLWTIRHPLCAICWFATGETYSAVMGE